MDSSLKIDICHHIFPAGTIVATPAALSSLWSAGVSPQRVLDRHLSGDWSELDPEDRKSNQTALIHGFRIFSRFTLRMNVVIWVITEADRSVTTLLLPEDY